MSWKDLYSEVKKRKMEALNKKDVVSAVEKHGKILAVSGKYEKPRKIVEHMYASMKKVIKEKEIMKENLSQYDDHVKFLREIPKNNSRVSSRSS